MRSGWIKSNFVFRSDYENGSDYARFMDCLTTYSKLGTNKHDDAPDSLKIMAEYIEFLAVDTTSTGDVEAGELFT